MECYFGCAKFKCIDHNINEVACSSTACLRRRPVGDCVINTFIVGQLGYNSILSCRAVNPEAGGTNHERTC